MTTAIVIKIGLCDTADGPKATERERRTVRIIKNKEVEVAAECVLIAS